MTTVAISQIVAKAQANHREKQLVHDAVGVGVILATVCSEGKMRAANRRESTDTICALTGFVKAVGCVCRSSTV